MIKADYGPAQTYDQVDAKRKNPACGKRRVRGDKEGWRILQITPFNDEFPTFALFCCHGCATDWMVNV